MNKTTRIRRLISISSSIIMWRMPDGVNLTCFVCNGELPDGTPCPDPTIMCSFANTNDQFGCVSPSIGLDINDVRMGRVHVSLDRIAIMFLKRHMLCLGDVEILRVLDKALGEFIHNLSRTGTGHVLRREVENNRKKHR